jgi:hypothetical protein
MPAVTAAAALVLSSRSDGSLNAWNRFPLFLNQSVSGLNRSLKIGGQGIQKNQHSVDLTQRQASPNLLERGSGAPIKCNSNNSIKGLTNG